MIQDIPLTYDMYVNILSAAYHIEDMISEDANILNDLRDKLKSYEGATQPHSIELTSEQAMVIYGSVMMASPIAKQVIQTMHFVASLSERRDRDVPSP